MKIHRSLTKVVILVGINFIILGLIFLSNYASAGYFEISPIFHDTQGERISYIINSQNKTDDQYIKVNVTKILSPNNDDEEEIAINSLRDIRVIPDKLILKPNDQRRVQVLVLAQDIDMEQVYRIYFQQVTEDQYHGTNLLNKDVSATSRVSLSLGGVIRVQPKENKPNIVANDDHIVNLGNSHFQIVSECVGTSMADCAWKKPEKNINVYHNNNYHWQTSDDKSVAAIKYRYPQQLNNLLTLEKDR
ncbi:MULTISPECIES: hypothetical protein [unclassified Vibrio]|uniref:hypothetical protein n=1 Tax=unclassified Vibrio TaxID=2614977 RepID=UPI000B8ECC6B|nr:MULTISPECIES: hypothetical protein [unclassified Vibrio]NAW91781.1 hypothetical protein [Vibrio sp. V24_P1S3T111]OXX19505.1 hypothetical protein B9J88_16750 [Vibrio sp. V05_P4A8T149]OXX34123.1 hypothetical protein B9J81_09550 [Vibrio sp. V04_P4A5T148]OXX36603.1 hypothetical protein B9J95_00010 [Vibrio sp. V14_P6S14T42]OXX57664.1 hypothetical protein B9J91_05160 [Vibrio sp. V18_P1S4T112]